MSRRLAAVLRSLLPAASLGRETPHATRLQTLKTVMIGLVDSLDAAAAVETRRRVPWRTWNGRRGFSTELLQTVSDMSEEQYHKLADRTLDDLVERIEAFLDEVALDESDVEYSQGVLTIKLGPLGTYVINKQTPNRQIWMSSPVSGPVRYDYSQGLWVYHRDGHQLLSRLQQELMQLTGEEIDLSPCYGCGKLNTCQGEQCS